MTHSEQQIQDALTLVKMPDAKTAKAWEAQLRADDPSAWFVVANHKRHTAIDSRMIAAVTTRLGANNGDVTLAYRIDAQTGARVTDPTFGGMAVPVFRVPTSMLDAAKSLGLTAIGD